jgi:coproporphyrinogen III oxidase-like Fe-S oxidoreductase
MQSAELIEGYGGPGPRYTSYPPATERTPSVGREEAAQALACANTNDAPLSIYVHIPFCVEICRFCGCNVDALRDEFGGEADQLFSEAQGPLKALEKDGLIALRPDGLDVLPLGRIFLRCVAMVFDAYLERHSNGKQAFSRAV